MSENDGFLSRWSRRKQEAARRTTAPGQQEAAAPRAEAAEPAGEGAPAGAAKTAAEVFDPANLPPLESIAAGTDIRGFLARGVPAELRHAALRRAWAADPAVRDFIGLSENSWDFTAPDGVPGFGPMRATDNIRELLAQAGGQRPELDLPGGAGDEPRPSESPSSQAADSQRETAAVSDGDDVADARAHEGVNIADDRRKSGETSARMQSANIDNKNEDVAAQNTNNSEGLSPVAGQRSHGGALPR